jgi:hypothetical protein
VSLSLSFVGIKCYTFCNLCCQFTSLSIQ